MWRRIHDLLIGPLLALQLGTTAVCAEEDPSATAQALFVEGRQLIEKGEYVTAREKLDASFQLEPAVGTLLGLAICEEALGKAASAWFKYRTVLEHAKMAGRSDRERAAMAALDALAARVSTLSVRVPPGLESLEDAVLRCDGIRISPTNVSSPLPVDPGEHVIDVVVKGALAWRATVSVGPNGKTTQVTIPEDVAAWNAAFSLGPYGEIREGAIPGRAVESSFPAALRSRSALARTGGQTSQRALVRDVFELRGKPEVSSSPRKEQPSTTAPWVWPTFGLGAAMTTTGLLVMGVAWWKKESLDCEGTVCAARDREGVDTYNDLRTVSMVSLAAGISALAAGIGLAFHSTDSSKSRATLRGTSVSFVWP